MEFVLATAVALLAILGALLCVGFLLVDPVRYPHGVGETQSLPDYHGTDFFHTPLSLYLEK